MPCRHWDGDEGLTLVEMVTVVLILGILVTVAVSSYVLATDRTYRIACLANQAAIRQSISQFEASRGSRPPDLAALVDGGFIKPPDYFGHCPQDPTGAAYTYDPVTGDVTCPRHPTGP